MMHDASSSSSSWRMTCHTGNFFEERRLAVDSSVDILSVSVSVTMYVDYREVDDGLPL